MLIITMLIIIIVKDNNSYLIAIMNSWAPIRICLLGYAFVLEKTNNIEKQMVCIHLIFQLFFTGWKIGNIGYYIIINNCNKIITIYFEYLINIE